MSDQIALFLPPSDEQPTWWETLLACAGCNRVTCRPPRSVRPCTWCDGQLVPVVRA